MKAILLSIKPKYCELIASGLKTVEIRKARPKIDTPFKVYMYQTRDVLWFYKILEWLKLYQRKVIGEFICDRIEFIDVIEMYGSFFHIHEAEMCLNEKSCLSNDEIDMYLQDKEGYAWHISDLVIYDEPKELNKFNVIDEKAVKGCKYRKRAYTNPDYTNGVCLPGSYICTKESETDWCSKCRIKPLTRPPQTWCYVENLEV